MAVQLKNLKQAGINKCGVKVEYFTQYVFLWLTCFTTQMGMGLVAPQLSVRVVEQGLSLQQFGIIQSIAVLLSIFTQVSIGKFSDRINRRKPLLIFGLLLFVPTVIIFPQAQTAVVFGILLSMFYMSHNTYVGMSNTWVSAWAEEGQMGRLHGSFKAAFSLGWIVATLAMGTLLDNYGFNMTFYIGAFFYGSAAMLVLFGAREGQLNKVVQAPKGETVDTSAESYQWSPKLTVILTSLGLFLLAQAMGFHLNFIFFAHQLEVSNQQFGLFTSMQAWFEIPFMLFFGIASDKLQGSKVLAVLMAFGGLRWLLLSFATSSWHLFFIQPFHAVGITVTQVLIIAVIARMVPNRFLGAVMGWVLTVRGVSRFLAPLLAGTMGDYLGMRIVFASSGILGILAALVVLQLPRFKD